MTREKRRETTPSTIVSNIPIEGELYITLRQSADENGRSLLRETEARLKDHLRKYPASNYILLR